MAVEAELIYGAYPFITAGPRGSLGGLGELDSVATEMMCGPDWEGDAGSLGYTHLRKIPGYHSMWVQTLDPNPDGETLNEVTAQCVGLMKNGEKRKRFLSAAGQEVSVGPVEKVVLVWSNDETAEDPEGGGTVEAKRRIPKVDAEGEVQYKTIATPSGTNTRWNIRDSILVVRDRYFTTVQPQTNVIGTVIAPPDAPTPPPYIWGGYNEPMRARHPNGWLLDDRQVDRLFWDGSSGLWAVDDTFGFYYGTVPD